MSKKEKQTPGVNALSDCDGYKVSHIPPAEKSFGVRPPPLVCVDFPIVAQIIEPIFLPLWNARKDPLAAAFKANSQAPREGTAGGGGRIAFRKKFFDKVLAKPVRALTGCNPAKKARKLSS